MVTYSFSQEPLGFDNGRVHLPKCIFCRFRSPVTSYVMFQMLFKALSRFAHVLCSFCSWTSSVFVAPGSPLRPRQNKWRQDLDTQQVGSPRVKKGSLLILTVCLCLRPDTSAQGCCNIDSSILYANPARENLRSYADRLGA